MNISKTNSHTYYRNGDNVAWRYGEDKTEGKVVRTYNFKITKRIKGGQITRAGSKNNPALLIRQNDGNRTLKLTSECE